jgi:hypothetical protein
MANQPIKFVKDTPANKWDCQLLNGDKLTGVHDIHFDIEAKEGPLVTVSFLIDTATMQTPDN